MKTIETVAIGLACCACWFAAGTMAATTTGKTLFVAPAAPESHLRVAQHTSRPVRPALAALSGPSAQINPKSSRPASIGGPARPGARTTMAVDGSGFTHKRRRVGP